MFSNNLILFESSFDAYKCPKCGKELLDIDTASRIEREFALRHTQEIEGYEAKISSDHNDNKFSNLDLVF
jgi:DNA-directed RNA polymerase subunit RPC12/RpoP